MVECIGGYFQFSVKADGLYFTVYPPKSGEQPATVADALYYLDKKKIMDCDTVKMKEAFSKAKEAPFTVKVSDAGALESREFGIYTMSSLYFIRRLKVRECWMKMKLSKISSIWA